ncbi:hypothetical protein [Burkholderia ambifaria]|uniref:hypothetical protein n=1 Tax=Burkholderia ambifaria TaxID=152480 RepID=UPI00158AA0CF|nr:hypothetical protein [Burkholderia ambifaria]MBR8344681.1 hypothetical protein [Burkholderia ambifaria]
MNCKLGDLAIVVRDDHEENIGRVVEIVAAAKFLTDAPAWLCQARGEPLVITWIDRAPQTFLDHTAEAYDADLMPISGVPVTDNVTDEVTA